MLTLGTFDGFHLGHQRTVDRLVAAGRELDAEPGAVLLQVSRRSRAGRRPPPALSGLRERVEWLRGGGVGLVVLDRCALGELGTSDLARILGRLGPRAVVLSEQIEIGDELLPGEPVLAHLGADLGVPVEVVSAVEVDGTRASAQEVRAALGRGDLGAAERLLGRPYGVSGRVVHGHHRGRLIGVPTANLRLRGLCLPPDGVYAIRARLDGGQWTGVANLGYNPTFGDTERSLEAHLFDFDEGIYGRRLEIRFIRWLRRERKFPDVGALVEQIRKDIAAAREVLSSR